ncbi:MAG: tRNA (adenosine(37)-N6)-threonylcarbamoyltransferase complex ATPase subunit type 1 TsaE [Rhodobacteraceae bacterium]|nr:tRNA (adenosine(37)-N6)-threonylcarbamoyltransferase complex ATPase subunit type 1 TsaE [Paracoccaceae bacterium]
MLPGPLSLTLHSPEDTADFARNLGALLVPGDCLLLEGEIGAGKTHFARSLIQSLQDMPEDVPSPTFTLVQFYETTAGELWHTDLYRLSALEEITELGLEDAFNTAICLVEWPDRLAELTPAHALRLVFATVPGDLDTRTLSLNWSDPKWTPRLNEVLND